MKFRSEMTLREFDKWLKDTCVRVPNGTVKCGGALVPTCDFLRYKFDFERDEWKYGTDVSWLDGTPLHHKGATWISKFFRNREILTETFFLDFMSKLAYEQKLLKEDISFESEGQSKVYCASKHRSLSDTEKKEICDDAMHFQHEVIEDLEYISSELNKLYTRLFKKKTNVQQS